MRTPFKDQSHWPQAHSNPIASFSAAIAAAGQAEPPLIEADGAIHRYRDPDGKPGNKDLWYVLYPDAVPAGAFGDWRAGVSHKWSAASKREMSAEDRAYFQRRMDEVRRQHAQVEARRHAQAAAKANLIWATCLPAEAGHPYLVKKGVTAGIARKSGEALVLPILSLDNRLQSIQFIQPNGAKRMLTGGAKKGHCIPCSSHQENPSRIIICEGWATGRTLAELDPPATVLAAIDAGNLESMAMNARIKWPDLPRVIACDDDRLTEGNPGLTKGRAAAIASGATILLPPWPSEAPIELTDFNDLHQWLKNRGGAA